MLTLLAGQENENATRADAKTWWIFDAAKISAVGRSRVSPLHQEVKERRF